MRRSLKKSSSDSGAPLLEPVSNPFPDFWDLLWTFLQLSGVPFLVLVPAMFLLSMLDWNNRVRKLRAGIELVRGAGTECSRKLDTIAVFRIAVLIALQAIAAAAVWAGTLWVVSNGARSGSLATPFETLVSKAVADPAAQPVASSSMAVAVGLALAFDAAWLSGNELAIKLIRLPCAIWVGLSLCASLGGALLAGFGLLVYGWPPDSMTSVFIGYAALGAVAASASRVSYAQLKQAFPQEASGSQSASRGFQNL
jgi:hypothetical protein